MNPITDAILLREALSTTRMALPDLSDLYHTKGNCPIHDGEHVTKSKPTEDTGTHYYTPVPTPELLLEWMGRVGMTRETMSYRLGVQPTFVDEILSGKVVLTDSVAFALGKLVGMTVSAKAEILEQVVHEDKPLLDKIGAFDAERVQKGIQAAKDGTFQGVPGPPDGPEHTN